MVTRHVTPLLLVALAACGTVQGRPPTLEEFNARGVLEGPGGDSGMDQAESDRILAQHQERLAGGFPIFADDELRFSVIGQPELTFDARVPAEGVIQYPMIGSLTLAGRTLEEVRADIKERLEKDYLVAAQVGVLVRAYAPKRVYVLGAVGAPRDYELPNGKQGTLLQAIAQAGGFLEDAGREGVVIYRPAQLGSTTRVPLTVDIVALQRGKGHDPILLPNDVIFVPSREKIYVHGQVTRPGDFTVPSGQTLTASQAIAKAGGFTRIANDGNVRLSRRLRSGERKSFVLDLSRVTGEHAGEDVPLQPGDVLFVPESVF
jgi:polysaccharide export outer membrane protein